MVLISVTTTALCSSDGQLITTVAQDEALKQHGRFSSPQDLVLFFSFCVAAVSRPEKFRGKKEFPLYTEWRHGQSAHHRHLVSPLGMESRNHRLEKTSKTIKCNHPSNTNKPTKPYPEVPHLHGF